jgi:hypothetical protein
MIWTDHCVRVCVDDRQFQQYTVLRSTLLSNHDSHAQVLQILLDTLASLHISLKSITKTYN